MDFDALLTSTLAENDAEISAIETAALEKELAELGISDEPAPASEEKETKEEPVVETKVEPVVDNSQELKSKISAYEKEIAELKSKEVPSFADFKDALKHHGFDEELVFKALLYDRATDGPNKTKLGTEIAEYRTKLEMKRLEDRMTAREKELAEKEAESKRAVESRAFYEKFNTDLGKTVDSVGETEKYLHSLVKAGKGELAKKLVLKEITDDARTRLDRGEDGDLLPPKEAIRRVEGLLTELLEAVNTKPVESKTSKTPIVPSKPIKNPTLSRDELVDLEIKKALLAINKG